MELLRAKVTDSGNDGDFTSGAEGDRDSDSDPYLKNFSLKSLEQLVAHSRLRGGLRKVGGGASTSFF